jgi:hypothetical protein
LVFNDELYVRRTVCASVDPTRGMDCCIKRMAVAEGDRSFFLRLLDRVRKLIIELHLSFLATKDQLRRMLKTLNFKVSDHTMIRHQLIAEQTELVLPLR